VAKKREPPDPPDDETQPRLPLDGNGAKPKREPPVFDITQGRALRDEALTHLEGVTTFQASALSAIHGAALACREFITDEAWARFDLATAVGDNRGMGAAIQTAKRLGWIEPTNRFQQSSMRQNHARPCRVWRSLVCQR